MWEPSKCPSAGEWMKKAQSCPTVGDPMDCSLSGSSVHGVFQECWSGLPFPSPGDLPDPGIEPGSSTLQADTLPSEPPGRSNGILLSHKECHDTAMWMQLAMTVLHGIAYMWHLKYDADEPVCELEIESKTGQTGGC